MLGKLTIFKTDIRNNDEYNTLHTIHNIVV